VTEGATAHEVALPPGDWVDAWSGEPVTGDAALHVDVPIDRIPVFVRTEAWQRLREVFEAGS
jgi:alpha-glucosidase (family GH31 glycosyl hydrolase)